MARPQSRYVCQRCGEAFLRWEGQCRACGDWNSLVETVVREPLAPRPVARPRRRGPAGAARRLAAIGDAGPARARRRDRRARPGPGRRARARARSILLGGEPGIGKSTLLLQAAAGLARGAGRIGRVLYATGEESAGPGPPAGGAPRAARRRRPATASQVLAEHDVGRIVEVARDRRGPALVVVDSIQTATVDELDGAAGSVGQVRESTLRLMDLAKGDGDRGHPRRPRDEGRLDRRAEDPRAPRRCGGQPRGRAVRRPAPAARVEEPVRVDRGGRRLRDGRAAACSRSPIRPAPSSPTTPGRRPAASSPRPWRAAGRCSSRSRRWSRPRRTAPRPGGRAASIPNRLEPADRGARPAGRHRPRRPRRLRQPGRRPGGRRARPRPAARPRPRVVAARSADRRRARSPSARSACSASCARSPASNAGCARPPGSGSTAAIVPRPRARRRPIRRRRASRIVEVATLREAIDGRASAERRRGSWRGRPGDARLTTRPGRLRSGDAGEVRPREPHLIRYIRVLGAALGGLVGLALADGRRRPVPRRRLRRRAARRLGRRLDRASASRSCRTSRSSRRPG